MKTLRLFRGWASILNASFFAVCLAAWPIGFSASAMGDLTFTYTGKPFDPSKCTAGGNLRCISGNVQENITFPGLSETYTGSIDAYNYSATGVVYTNVVLNSIEVTGSQYMPSPQLVCLLSGTISFEKGNIVAWQFGVTMGVDSTRCNQRQAQVNTTKDYDDEARIFQYPSSSSNYEEGFVDRNNGKWTAIDTSACGDERDAIIKEYYKYEVDFLEQNFGKLQFRPTCDDFTQSAHSSVFQFTQLNGGDYSWALIRQPLVNPAPGDGLDYFVSLIKKIPSITSAYRNPKRNFALYKGDLRRLTRGSRHMFGDAVDIVNEKHSLKEYYFLRAKAVAAGANYVEPPSGDKSICLLVCFHADWRLNPGGYAK